MAGSSSILVVIAKFYGRANRRLDGSAPRSFPRLIMRHAVLEDACDSSATDISILQDTTRLHIDNKSKANTCSIVLVVPAHTLLCVEKFSHSLQETEVVKENDEHVRFAVPQARWLSRASMSAATAMLAMVTYRCMLPPINRRAGKIKHK